MVVVLVVLVVFVLLPVSRL